ncbi:response regulator [Aureibaculum algae]|uniref:histidine kinase n=1 Tax=Aureibaculum algae TaxID=2584122 RepID=A0A5B7TYB5_9FLAO|nr:two-component regulator propeller domain-containing protein [Aureibaculum algae]QCX40344.1 response regulator [Aureibaculum algae]
MKLRYTIFFVFIAFFVELYAQNPIYFEHINSSKGLSQNDVNCIYQDEKGYMWFGTHDGLNKYDGYDFTVYQPGMGNENSISSNLIFAIDGDKQGNLWVGTTGGGLNYFDRVTEKFTVFKNIEEDDTSLDSNHIISVLLDKNNRLWVGTKIGLNVANLNVGVTNLKFKRLTLEKILPESDVNNDITSLFEDADENIWVSSYLGVYKISKDSYEIEKKNNQFNLPNFNFQSIAQDAYGRFVVTSGNGVFIQQKTGESFEMVKILSGIYNELEFDNNNQIWVGSNKGLVLLDNSDKNRLPKWIDHLKNESANTKSISKNIISSIFKDQTGIMWVGTNGGGINKYDPQRKNFRHIKKTTDPNSLSYDKIRSIFEDSNGTLWIGTEGGGLNYIIKENDDGTYKNFQKFESISKTFTISEVLLNNKKTLLFGGESAPVLYQLDISDPKKIDEKNIKPIADVKSSVFSILKDHKKNFWIGTYDNGVYRYVFDVNSNSYKKNIYYHNKNNPNSIANDIIRNIYEDSHGNIWFATGNGLSKLDASQTDKEEPVFQSCRNILGDSSSINHNYILSIYESNKGTLWIGTFGGGLSKVIDDKKGENIKFKNYSEKDGLPNNVIKGILEDGQGNLWLSSNKGLTKFNPENESFKNYDVNDGLQSEEFQELACWKRKDGEMLFGGVNGFNAFYPDEIKDNTFPSETVVTNFSIFNKPVKIGEKIARRVILDKSIDEISKIRIDYKDNSFSFEFAGLHYAAPLKNKYAYKLEGFDKDWIYTNSTKRFATYTNLQPGSYTLMAKASNNDGIWDDTPSKIELTIIPPWWRTIVAYISYGLLAIAMLLAFRRFTIIRTTEKHQLQLDHLEKEKREELQQLKLEFFTNISHEFRTPLTLIKGPLKYLQKNIDSLDKETIKEQYGLMEKNTESLMRLINQLLDFRKLNQGKMKLVVRNGNIISFIKEVGETFQFLAHKNDINFTINSEENVISSWFDHDAIEKIMNNLLSNAFKFTPNNGSVIATISKEVGANNGMDSVVVSVKDSGPGIPKAKEHHIFERFYVEKNYEKQNKTGSGIGLSFTKSLVELHQGSIEVFSSPEQGTTFTFKLPTEKNAYLKKPDITCKEENDSDYLIRTSEAELFAVDMNDDILDQDLTKTKSKLPALLVVDDNPDIRSFIKQVLSKDYSVYEANNGKVGLEIANKIVPNIILTDLLMPVMDGEEFCLKLKTTKETSHIPVIMLTAKASQESEINSLKIGADGYVRKPFDIEILELKIKNIIKQRDELRRRFSRDITLQPKEVTVTSVDEKFLQHAIEIVEKNMMNTEFNVEMLVKEMGHSRSNLYLKFKELTGLSSSEFIRNIKLKRAVQLFESSDLLVKEIMYQTGFNTASYFAKCFKKQFGVIPSEYVKQKE